MGADGKPFEGKPTVKQEKLITAILEGKSLAQAGLEAGYSPDSPAQVASNQLKKPWVREPLTKILDEQGARREAAAKRIAEALDADATGIVQRTGEVVELGPDHPTRLKAADLVLKYHGESPTQKHLVGVMDLNEFFAEKEGV